ncbi:MAG: hypothetical protein K6E40_06305 [Desulfovibrio sp.]|nr:hypothetical protein [Desulfovibrio sp.]
MSRLHLDARGAGLAFEGTGNRLGSILLDGGTSVSVGVSGMAPGQASAVLTFGTKNNQKAGSFAVSATKAQTPGYYRLASGSSYVMAPAVRADWMKRGNAYGNKLQGGVDGPCSGPEAGTTASPAAEAGTARSGAPRARGGTLSQRRPEP